jgi:hypothetical protein
MRLYLNSGILKQMELFPAPSKTSEKSEANQDLTCLQCAPAESFLPPTLIFLQHDIKIHFYYLKSMQIIFEL